ncbi:MAG: peptide-N-glycosidase F-related protein [Bacteroidota bacterium]
MKKIYLILFLLSIIHNTNALNGDTTKIRAFDKLDMNHYGNFDAWVKFPDGAKKYQKIIMKYTLGCLSNGQCEWDYTNTLLVRENTGLKDSTQKQAPNYTIVGQSTTPDTLYYLTDTAYKYFFNTTTQTADSTKQNAIVVLLYNNTSNPTLVTDTLKVWPTYYRVNYNGSGVATDSTLVKNSASYIAKAMRTYYQVFDIINDYELGRMITPYAKFFNKNFQYTYVFDVTDFAGKLKDSVQIRMDYSGYSYGFTATVDFEMIEGTPNREVAKIENIYKGYFPYGNTSNPIDNFLPAKAFTQDAGTKSIKLRLTVTGHGGENNEGCSEFCAKKYFLKLNNTQIAEQLVWKDDCGKNAIINQGGTWIYDRANWCPGEQIAPYEYELNTQSGNNNVDIDFEDFVANGSAGYQVMATLIHYKDYSYNNEVGLQEILWPSNDFRYQRLNPSCQAARVSVKNNGKNPLTSFTVKYQSGDKRINSFVWKGNIPFGATSTIDLGYIQWDANVKTFKVWVESPNGATDENTTNNNLQVGNIVSPPTFPSQIIIETTTNKLPGENRWIIKNENGDTIASKLFTKTSTRHLDTVNIGYGCYTFQFDDAGKDGLSFWASSANTGSGSLRITATNPYRVLKTYNADFGTFITQHFTGQAPLSVNDMDETKNTMLVFPNPASKTVSIQLDMPLNFESKTYQVFNIQGQLVYSHTTADYLVDIDLSNFSQGIYFAVVNTNNKSFTQKFMVK